MKKQSETIGLIWYNAPTYNASKGIALFVSKSTFTCPERKSKGKSCERRVRTLDTYVLFHCSIVPWP